MLCKAMKFSALPVAGGMYDQDPILLEEWTYIIHVEAEAERRRAEADRRKQSSASRARRR